MVLVLLRVSEATYKREEEEEYLNLMSTSLDSSTLQKCAV
jgi:hypothetical protein